MATVAKEKGAVHVTRLENDALKEENEQLGRELASVTAGGEEVTSEGKRRRTEATYISIKKTLPRLPTEVWAEVAAKIHRDDVMAFALTSKQLREAQQQAERELVTRLYFTDWTVRVFPTLLHQDCVYFTRDWCTWWIKRFNTTETKDDHIRSVIKVAAYHGYVDVLESGVPEEKTPLLMNVRTVWFAALGGRLEVLKWLRSEGCPGHESACSYAAAGGHLEILKWLKSQGCPWNEWDCAGAAAEGHFEVLKWLRSEGCPWDEWACAHAAAGGQLETLKWLRSEGCPWDEEVCFGAAKVGHLEVLKWLRGEGCP